MSQNDMSLANAAGATFRSDVNSALQALASNNSGATEPGTTYAYQWWADTSTGLLKVRNAANSAWITVGTLATANLALVPQSFSTDLTIAASTSDGADNLSIQLASGGAASVSRGAFLSLYGNEDAGNGVAELRAGEDGFGIFVSGNPGYLEISSVSGSFPVYVNDAGNSFSTAGLTLNQGANDDEILSLKSSDVAHGVTTLTETDTYGFFQKFSGANGALQIVGLGEATRGIDVYSISTTAVTTKSTASAGALSINGALVSGTGVTSLGANSNIMVVQDNGTTRFIMDADGDSHQDVGTAWTNFDDRDDVATLDALAYNVARADDPIKRKFGEFLVEKRPELERANLVTFSADGHHFVNMSKLTMLHTGAIRQLGERFEALAAGMAARLDAIEQKLLAA